MIARYFYGIEFAPRDLRLGLVEASEERIGSAIDAVLLLCYHYDPATGKYGAAALPWSGSARVATIAAFADVPVRLAPARARRELADGCGRQSNLNDVHELSVLSAAGVGAGRPGRRALLLHGRRDGVLLDPDRRPGRATSRSSTAAGTATRSATRSTDRWRSSCSGRSSRSSSSWSCSCWGAKVFFDI